MVKRARQSANLYAVFIVCECSLGSALRLPSPPRTTQGDARADALASWCSRALPANWKGACRANDHDHGLITTLLLVPLRHPFHSLSRHCRRSLCTGLPSFNTHPIYACVHAVRAVQRSFSCINRDVSCQGGRSKPIPSVQRQLASSAWRLWRTSPVSHMPLSCPCPAPVSVQLRCIIRSRAVASDPLADRYLRVDHGE